MLTQMYCTFWFSNSELLLVFKITCMIVLSLIGNGDFDGVSNQVTNPAELYSMTPNEGGINGGTEISLTGTKYLSFSNAS